ncbi:hypothetical protein BgiBS90_027345, partial [Biomphalaria glabrata]
QIVRSRLTRYTTRVEQKVNESLCLTDERVQEIMQGRHVIVSHHSYQGVPFPRAMGGFD